MTDEVAATEAVAPETVTEAPETEQVEGQEAAEETPEEAEKKSAAKERREREKAYKARLREDREAALSKAAAAEARIERIKAAGSATTEPLEKEFADYTEYVAAKAVWKHSKGLSEREAGEISAEAEHARRVAEELEQRERALMVQNYDAQRQEARTRYSDFDAVVAQQGLFPVGTHLPDLVLQSDAPADVAYAIASDRNLHDTLLRSDPVSAARMIGRIEAQLSLPKPRTQSKAPDPINPVRGTAASGKSPDKMTHAEFVAWREAGGTF